MAALTAARNTPSRATSFGDRWDFPAAAAETIFQGSLVAFDSTAGVISGITSLTVRGLGRAEFDVDNSGGAKGDKTVVVRTGIFAFATATGGGDDIAADDIGKVCYIVDDQTVALTNGAATRSVAGTIADVDSDGVWVSFNFPLEFP